MLLCIYIIQHVSNLRLKRSLRFGGEFFSFCTNVLWPWLPFTETTRNNCGKEAMNKRLQATKIMIFFSQGSSVYIRIS